MTPSTNPKIGVIDANGTPQYPSESVTGKPYERDERGQAPAHIHMLGGGYFCVEPDFYPPGFDVQAAIDALKAELNPPAPTPAPEPKAASRKNPPSTPAAPDVPPTEQG